MIGFYSLFAYCAYRACCAVLCSGQPHFVPLEPKASSTSLQYVYLHTGQETCNREAILITPPKTVWTVGLLTTARDHSRSLMSFFAYCFYSHMAVWPKSITYGLLPSPHIALASYRHMGVCPFALSAQNALRCLCLVCFVYSRVACRGLLTPALLTTDDASNPFLHFTAYISGNELAPINELLKITGSAAVKAKQLLASSNK